MIPDIGLTVLRNGRIDWLTQKLFLIGLTPKGEPIHEPAVLVWGATGKRWQRGDVWEMN